MSRFMPLAFSGTGGGPGTGFPPRIIDVPAAPRRSVARRPARSRAFAAIAALGLAVCVAGFFVTLQTDDSDAPDGLIPAEIGARGGLPARPHAPPSPPVAASAIADLPLAAGPRDAHESALPAHGRAPARKSAGGSAGNDRSPSTTSGPPFDPTESNWEAAAEVPPQDPAPVALPPEPVVPDRWQAMSADIARCGREDFLAGVICEQRVRLRYCDGFWGKVPHCGGAIRFESAR